MQRRSDAARAGGGGEDFEDALIGEDPRKVERLYWKMYRISRQHLGGSAHRAMAGIELALWDIKARALGVSVSELHGGPIRERQHVYWIHCGTVRARNWELAGTPPICDLRRHHGAGQGGRERRGSRR